MSITFGIVGNIPLSVFNHLQTNFVASGIGSGALSGTFRHGYLDDDELKRIRFPDEYLEGNTTSDDIIMPIITFDEAPLQLRPLEMGSTNRWHEQRFLVSVYATNELQKMQLTNQIIYNLDQKSITLKDYSSNYDSPSTLGVVKIDPSSIRALPVRSTRNEELPDSRVFRHRMEVIFTARDK